MELLTTYDLRLLRDLEQLRRISIDLAEIERIERVRKDCEAIRAAAQPWARHLALVEEYKKAEELRNSWRDIMQAVAANLPCTMKHVLHRVQGRPGGSKGKTSAKQKSNSSSGSSGGSDGGGDSDGPHRNHVKHKRRTSSISSISSRPSSVSSDAIANNSSPHPPPHRSSQGRDISLILIIFFLFAIALIVKSVVLQALVILCLFAIAFGTMGYPEIAKYVLSIVPNVLDRLGKPTEPES
jgi:hypothetical protein